MKISQRLFIFISIGILSIFNLQENLCAEEDFAGDSNQMQNEIILERSSYGVFKEIKARIAALLVENKKLETEYAAIQKEYAQTKVLVEQHRNEIDMMHQHFLETNRERKDTKKAVKSLRVGQDSMANDILIKQSRIAYLKGELLDMEEKERLWNLQLADLGYQKRQLEMDYKYKNFYSQENQRRQNEELNNLKKELKSLLEQERELKHQISELETKRESYPYKAQRLTEENKEWEDKIKALQKDLDFKMRENATLREKQSFTVKSAEYTRNQKEQEKVELTEEVQNFQKELDNFNQNVDLSLLRQDRKRQLVQEIINIDKENQQLRDKITDLQQKLTSLRNKKE